MFKKIISFIVSTFLCIAFGAGVGYSVGRLVLWAYPELPPFQ